MKYTREILEDAVKCSKSIREVMRKIGSSPYSGGSHKHISTKIAKFNIDTSHFDPYAYYKNGGKKKSPEEIFAMNKKTKSHQLRRALISIGRQYECEECGTSNMWNNKPLVLHVDHKDGNVTNNDQNNLRFLCPNCHTQTPTYGVIKNKVASMECRECQNKIRKNNKSGYCYKCYWKQRKSKLEPKQKIKKNSKCPDLKLLKELIWEMPTTKIAKKYGVSDKAVSKWCKKYGLTKPGPGYWSKERSGPMEECPEW